MDHDMLLGPESQELKVVANTQYYQAAPKCYFLALAGQMYSKASDEELGTS